MSRHAVLYDVPSYKQGRTSLCWAYSEIMIESYRTNIKLSYDETVERAMIATDGLFAMVCLGPLSSVIPNVMEERIQSIYTLKYLKNSISLQ